MSTDPNICIILGSVSVTTPWLLSMGHIFLFLSYLLFFLLSVLQPEHCSRYLVGPLDTVIFLWRVWIFILVHSRYYLKSNMVFQFQSCWRSLCLTNSEQDINPQQFKDAWGQTKSGRTGRDSSLGRWRSLRWDPHLYDFFLEGIFQSTECWVGKDQGEKYKVIGLRC